MGGIVRDSERRNRRSIFHLLKKGGNEMKRIPKWKIKRQEQIEMRIILFLFVIALLFGAYALGSTIMFMQIMGKEVYNEPQKSNVGLYAGITDIDFESIPVAEVVKEEVDLVTSSETEIENGETKYTHEEYVLLAKLIYRETGNQGWDCMVACGSVVMNRLHSNKYPNTIKGVIFQSGQYSVTRNRTRFYNTVPSEDAYMVAELILNEGSQIPSNVLYQSQSALGSGIWKTINGEVYSYE